jgi:hypothetical protein
MDHAGARSHKTEILFIPITAETTEQKMFIRSVKKKKAEDCME